ncbi:MAG: B12-binding domain-containing radical SAM protein [Lachnospira sp.]|nr:B12-binding domain-containing radical SAM protein [Lachnospira sp.]
MKVLLTAINSKYIHSNLAVYSLKAYHDQHTNGTCQIELAEYTINQQIDEYIADIYRKRPDVIAFSCYIWNIRYVYEAIVELKKLMPHMKIWLGGPEVSFHAEKILREHPEVDGIMCGEGEKSFTELCNCGFLQNLQTLRNDANDTYDAGMIEKIGIPGIVFRIDEQIHATQPVDPMNIDELPFVYEDLCKFQNKIIYYESSRGCPFGCSYCLSSVDKAVRFRSLSLVFQELQFFLDAKIPQVKFVDRTFNCNHERTVSLLSFLRDHDNGVTNFHFEIAADLLRDDEIELLAALRPGLVQLEIGVQSTNELTIHNINRVMDFSHLSSVVSRLNMGKNVHLHLDLIAGLPNEDLTSFHNSFNDVYGLEPEQLQLGFLKVLKGSPMEQKTEEYKILYKDAPPFEVLSTKWLSFDDILHLKQIEEMVEVYYNSRQYVNTIRVLGEYMKDAFCMFEALAHYYHSQGLFGIKHSRISRYEILYRFIMGNVHDSHMKEVFREILLYDLYLRENLKTRPYFADSIDEIRTQLHALYSTANVSKSAHIERFSKTLLQWVEKPKERQLEQNDTFGKINKSPAVDMNQLFLDDSKIWVLFDYDERDPLNYNCKVHRIVID